MSLRNIRKIYGGIQLPPPDEDSEEYEPPCTQRQSKSIYAGLEISSDSENNTEVGNESAEEESKPKVKTSKKKQRNKKKQKQRKSTEELDEIDQCVKEVNALLGEPPKPPEVEPKEDIEKMKRDIFTVKQQNMDPIVELDRRFGPDETEQKKPGRRPNLRRIAQKGFIIATDKVYKKNGLIMTMLDRKNDISYFSFQHSKNYQNLHHVFLYAHKTHSIERAPYLEFPFEESQRRMHVEGLLETADRFYMMEEYAAGNKVIEEVISYMQHCAHPYFSVTDVRTRLLYKHVENRAFHIALLKYMHMLTNKACHRTALEMAKILLNLDPSDPLAVLYMVDTIAMRAEDHQWFINAFEFWNKDKHAGFMFNMQYSYALAHFHVARRNKDGFEKADELIQDAMLRFPTVLVNIFKHSGNRSEKVKDCPLFGEEFNRSTSSNLNNLIFLYTKFIWHKFTERPILKWLKRNAEELADRYATDTKTQGAAKAYRQLRMSLFQIYPVEIIRHLSIIKPLSYLIVDGAVPDIGKVVSYDPLPPADGISLYDEVQPNGQRNVNYFEIFSSMLPDYDLQDTPMEHRNDLPRVFQPELQPDAFHGDDVVFTDDSESESDTDEDSNSAPSHAVANINDDLNLFELDPHTGTVRLFDELYESIFGEVFMEYPRRPLLVHQFINLEYVIAVSELNMIGSLSITTFQTEVMDYSGGFRMPLLATLHIRNASRFYYDVSVPSIAFREQAGNLMQIEAAQPGNSDDIQEKTSNINRINEPSGEENSDNHQLSYATDVDGESSGYSHIGNGYGGSGGEVSHNGDDCEDRDSDDDDKQDSDDDDDEQDSDDNDEQDSDDDDTDTDDDSISRPCLMIVWRGSSNQEREELPENFDLQDVETPPENHTLSDDDFDSDSCSIFSISSSDIEEENYLKSRNFVGILYNSWHSITERIQHVIPLLKDSMYCSFDDDTSSGESSDESNINTLHVANAAHFETDMSNLIKSDIDTAIVVVGVSPALNYFRVRCSRRPVPMDPGAVDCFIQVIHAECASNKQNCNGNDNSGNDLNDNEQDNDDDDEDRIKAENEVPIEKSPSDVEEPPLNKDGQLVDVQQVDVQQVDVQQVDVQQVDVQQVDVQHVDVQQVDVQQVDVQQVDVQHVDVQQVDVQQVDVQHVDVQQVDVQQVDVQHVDVQQVDVEQVDVQQSNDYNDDDDEKLCSEQHESSSAIADNDSGENANVAPQLDGENAADSEEDHDRATVKFKLFFYCLKRSPSRSKFRFIPLNIS